MKVGRPLAPKKMLYALTARVAHLAIAPSNLLSKTMKKS